MTIELRKFEDTDLQLFEAWLSKAHVAKWYHDPEDWFLEVRERKREFHFLHHYIVIHQSRPIGFCQYYLFAYSGEDWHGKYSLEGTYSIDYMIGEKQYTGQGLGKRIVAYLTEKIMKLEGCERIIVQPEMENLASCGALLSNGYAFDEENKLYILEK
ncbi:GNAT family N-acetyltransferase [uncultured Enterococcus sp.]|uniref:GNAT family N-acetyltransferase n=1 Tax=uncultured Enterococcus sp. TaxID=167972 RepID=UPI002AA779BE|nr:GNAT family N-acetyltransferase [uncultured Enterococcus sp.]